MKAYVAHDRNCDCPYSMVIYADSPGKARAIAAMSEEFEDFAFTHILVKRCADLDEFYHGTEILDWYNPYDRLLMVKYAIFRARMKWIWQSAIAASAPLKTFVTGIKNNSGMRRWRNEQSGTCQHQAEMV